MKLLLTYLLIVNAAGFVFMLADKYKAKKSLWRIPEKILIGIALIGGSLGCIGGMYAVCHKTKHLKFTLGIPLILAVQIIAAIIILF
jgi:uncharacterized membrane protein YsdA (DUF1294 family)